jgi:NADH:ubiquinone oxidoreductase subunit K
MINLPASWLIPVCSAFGAMLAVAGLYCILVTRNMIRTLIGIELLIKAVTLLVVLFGYVRQVTALAQTIVITLIVIEVFFLTIACGIILSLYKQTQSIDASVLRGSDGGNA